MYALLVWARRRGGRKERGGDRVITQKVITTRQMDTGEEGEEEKIMMMAAEGETENCRCSQDEMGRRHNSRGKVYIISLFYFLQGGLVVHIP